MKDLLERLGIVELNQGALVGLDRLDCRGKTLESISPIDGRILAKIRQPDPAGYEEVVQAAEAAFNQWRDVPAPKRGEVVRQIGNAFRERKKDLGALISLEMGKIPAEAEGEVQELIDRLRLCSRPVANALWFFHAQRKARASHVRTISSAWPCRCYHGV